MKINIMFLPAVKRKGCLTEIIAYRITRGTEIDEWIELDKREARKIGSIWQVLWELERIGCVTEIQFKTENGSEVRLGFPGMFEGLPLINDQRAAYLNLMENGWKPISGSHAESLGLKSFVDFTGACIPVLESEVNGTTFHFDAIGISFKFGKEVIWYHEPPPF